MGDQNPITTGDRAMSITANIEPKIEDPNHTQHMLDVADGGDVLIAGKYKTPEDLDKGIMELVTKRYRDINKRAEFYKELEKGFGKPNDGLKPNDGGTPADNSNQPQDINPTGILTNEDLDKYNTEFAKEGKLSDDTYKELQEKYNLPKQMVDTWIQGRIAEGQVYTNQVVSECGDIDTYNKMCTWASKNITPEEITQFNSDIDSFDVTKAKNAVSNLYKKYTAAVGVPPKRYYQGESNSSGSSGGYLSRAEMIRDMSDPKYKSDPAFREAVSRKVARSNLF